MGYISDIKYLLEDFPNYLGDVFKQAVTNMTLLPLAKAIRKQGLTIRTSVIPAPLLTQEKAGNLLLNTRHQKPDYEYFAIAVAHLVDPGSNRWEISIYNTKSADTDLPLTSDGRTYTAYSHQNTSIDYILELLSHVQAHASDSEMSAFEAAPWNCWYSRSPFEIFKRYSLLHGDRYPKNHIFHVAGTAFRSQQENTGLFSDLRARFQDAVYRGTGLSPDSHTPVLTPRRTFRDDQERQFEIKREHLFSQMLAHGLSEEAAAEIIRNGHQKDPGKLITEHGLSESLAAEIVKIFTSPYQNPRAPQ